MTSLHSRYHFLHKLALISSFHLSSTLPEMLLPARTLQDGLGSGGGGRGWASPLKCFGILWPLPPLKSPCSIPLLDNETLQGMEWIMFIFVSPLPATIPGTWNKINACLLNKYFLVKFYQMTLHSYCLCIVFI